jgi:glycerate kinase
VSHSSGSGGATVAAHVLCLPIFLRRMVLPVKVVLAPDSFKGCLTAAEVCEALAVGLRRVWADVQTVAVPMADGGEGTVDSLVAATGGELVQVEVEGPLGDPVIAHFGILGDGQTAVIEMASASGLTLVPPARRNPLLTSTFGTGQLIRAALDRGCRRLLIGIGGSATNDGGTGMAQALGARFLDAAGAEIPRMAGGQLSNIARIDVSALDSRLQQTQVRVACDVTNPLCGPTGAAAVYGPQKGATPEMVALLDAGLCHYARRLREDLGADVADVPGAGAAGGLGAGLMAFCGASLERGVDIVVDAVHLAEKLQGADLCITGEGRIDFQTAFGKTASGVAKVAGAQGVPVVAVGGSVELGVGGFAATLSILNEPLSLEQAMEPARAREMIAHTAEQIARLIAL